MATFITGDKHGDLTEILNFIKKMKLSENDNIIVLGDMGLLWRKDKKDFNYNINLWNMESNGVKLYFIDGNHENFTLLKEFPIENNMQKISNNIYHLLRGHIYEFEGKKILTIGGADSIDWYLRTKGFTWWKEETISKTDIASIAAAHYDYVLTHCCPRSIFENNRVYLITLREIDQEKVNHNSEDMLEQVKKRITFDHWYFGHYHIDKELDSNFRCVFHDFIEVR